MIIDAKNLIAGRLAAFAAKQALLGEEIAIVNSEKAIITGSKKNIMAKYKTMNERGEPFHGPFIKKIPDRFLKRIIRGMLPYKKGNGRQAYKRIKCYKGVPKEFQDKKTETVNKANITKVQLAKYMTVGEVCQNLKLR